MTNWVQGDRVTVAKPWSDGIEFLGLSGSIVRHYVEDDWCWEVQLDNGELICFATEELERCN